jgi:hypothetical protein
MFSGSATFRLGGQCLETHHDAGSERNTTSVGYYELFDWRPCPARRWLIASDDILSKDSATLWPSVVISVHEMRSGAIQRTS